MVGNSVVVLFALGPHTLPSVVWPCPGKWEFPIPSLGPEGTEQILLRKFSPMWGLHLQVSVSPHMDPHGSGKTRGQVEGTSGYCLRKNAQTYLHRRLDQYMTTEDLKQTI